MTHMFLIAVIMAGAMQLNNWLHRKGRESPTFTKKAWHAVGIAFVVYLMILFLLIVFA